MAAHTAVDESIIHRAAAATPAAEPNLQSLVRMQIGNKVWYGGVGAKDLIGRTCVDLPRKLTVSWGASLIPCKLPAEMLDSRCPCTELSCPGRSSALRHSGTDPLSPATGVLRVIQGLCCCLEMCGARQGQRARLIGLRYHVISRGWVKV